MEKVEADLLMAEEVNQDLLDQISRLERTKSSSKRASVLEESNRLQDELAKLKCKNTCMF